MSRWGIGSLQDPRGQLPHNLNDGLSSWLSLLMSQKRRPNPVLDDSRGIMNFGDESLYFVVLKDYAEELLAAVHRIESMDDKARLKDEVALLRGSASYMGAERLKMAAAALLLALESCQGNETALRATLCEQARAVCVEARTLAAGGRGAAGTGASEMAAELVPVLEGAVEKPPRLLGSADPFILPKLQEVHWVSLAMRVSRPGPR
eukprot:s2992_g3.t1